MKKNVLGTYGLQITNVIFSFFMSIAIARILGASERGEMVIFITSTNFMSAIMEFCLGSAITYFVASGKFPVGRTFTTIVYWTLISLAVTSVIVFFSPLFHIDRFLFATISPGLQMKSIFVLVTVLGVFNSLITAMFSARKLFKIINILSLSVLILTNAVYGVLWFLSAQMNYKFSSSAIILTTAAVLVVKIIMTLFLYTKYIKEPSSNKILDKGSLKSLFSLSFINYIGSTVQFLTYRMDFWFVDYYSGNKELGIYSLSANLAQLFWMLPHAVGVVLFPNIASMDREQAIRQTRMLCRMIFTFTVVTGVAGGLLLGYLIPYIYGKEFFTAGKLFFVLLIGILPFSIKIIIASYYAGIQRTRIDMLSSIISFVLCLLLDIILIPRYGSMGAAIATVVAYSANTIFMIFTFSHFTKSPLGSFLILKKEDVQLLISHLPFRKKQLPGKTIVPAEPN